MPSIAEQILEKIGIKYKPREKPKIEPVPSQPYLPYAPGGLTKAFRSTTGYTAAGGPKPPVLFPQKPEVKTQKPAAEPTVKKPAVKTVKPKDVPKTVEKKPEEKPVEKPEEKQNILKAWQDFLVEAKSPLQQIVGTATSQIETLQKDYAKTIEDYKKQATEVNSKIDEILSRLTRELESPIPKPPAKEEITIPKEPLLALVKAISPIVIGLIAMLRPGKYGENLYFFNSMYEAILTEDNRKFQESLEKWQRETQAGLEDKRNRIESLKLLVERERQKEATQRTLTELQLRAIENKIKEYETQYKTAETALKNIEDSFNKLADSMRKTEELKLRYSDLQRKWVETSEKLKRGEKGLKPTSKERDISAIESAIRRRLTNKEKLDFYAGGPAKQALLAALQAEISGKPQIAEKKNVLDTLKSIFSSKPATETPEDVYSFGP